MALDYRTIKMSAEWQKNEPFEFSFTPKLTGADGEILLAKTYYFRLYPDGKIGLPASNGYGNWTKTDTDTFELPVRSTGTISYQYKLPQDLGYQFSTGWIHLSAGAEIMIDDLIPGSTQATDTLIDYIDQEINALDFLTESDADDLYYGKEEIDLFLDDVVLDEDLAEVAFSGDYEDLINTPASVSSEWETILNKPANIEAWALLAPSTKQNQSANLDGWSALATSAKQDASANLNSWSLLNPTTFNIAQSQVIDLVTDLSNKADLVGGLIPSAQLPGFVDDVLEFADLASFPATGESGKLYTAADTNLVYRWTGSTYAVTSSSLALGETSSTAYRGDRGKIAYDFSQNANLQTFSGIEPSANVQSLLAAADYAAIRTALGLAIGTDVQAYNANTAFLNTAQLWSANQTFVKTNTATAGTQYPSYDLILQGSAWNTSGAAAVNRSVTSRLIAGSGASGSEPYRLAFLNNGGTEFAALNPLTGAILVGTGSAASPSMAFLAEPTTGFYNPNGTIGVAFGGSETMRFRPNNGEGIRMSSGFGYYFASGASNATVSDTGLLRHGNGIIEINNAAPGTFRDLIIRKLYIGSTTVFDSAGAGSPEGVVSASIGSTYRRTDGGAGTSFWVKESGSSTTGWVAK